MRKLTEEEMQELVEYLQGTCKALYQALYELFGISDESEVENELEMCHFIDNAIFLCHQCGWWCEVGDWITEENDNYIDGENICAQCGDE